MSNGDKQDDIGMWLVIAMGACMLGFAAWARLPQAFLLPIGMGVGAIATLARGSDGPAWRAAGIRLILVGLVLGVAFVLIDGAIGADAQMRRFERAWNVGAKTAAALKHPWATIPLGAAFLLAGVGTALVWRAK